jgi:hypothetical protein
VGVAPVVAEEAFAASANAGTLAATQAGEGATDFVVDDRAALHRAAQTARCMDDGLQGLVPHR